MKFCGGLNRADFLLSARFPKIAPVDIFRLVFYSFKDTYYNLSLIIPVPEPRSVGALVSAGSDRALLPCVLSCV